MINDKEIKQVRYYRVRKCPRCKLIFLKNDKSDSDLWKCSNCTFKINTPYLSRWINSNYGGRMADQIRNKIIYFANWLRENKNKGSVLDAKGEDLFDFFLNDINPRKLKLDTANRWRTHLRLYYSFIQKWYKMNDIDDFKNPVPDREFFKFKKHYKEDDSFVEPFQTYKTTERLLKFFLLRGKYRMFMVYSLCTYTMFRIGEVITIEIKNIDLENRFIKSGYEKNFSKRGPVIGFFPPFFKRTLEIYIRDQLTKGEKWLFPTPSKKSKHEFILPESIRKQLRKTKKLLKITEPINPHACRDMGNTEFGENGLKDKHCDILQNRKPKSVGIASYNNRFKNWKENLENFDENFPYPDFILPQNFKMVKKK